MGALKRAVAVYLVGLAVVVAVNFAIAPLYHPPGAETYPVWEVLNWFQAASVLIALVSIRSASAPSTAARTARLPAATSRSTCPSTARWC